MGVFLLARRDPLGFLLESMRRFGDVVSMRFGRRRAYLLSHPRDLRRVLEDDEGIYVKAPAAARAGALFGDSLTTADGEGWRRRRRLMRPAFRPTSLPRVVPVVTDTTARMLDRWASIARRGDAVDLSREMTDLTQAIIVRLAFGEVGEAQLGSVGEAIERAAQHANRRLWSLLGRFELPAPGLLRHQAALRAVDTFIRTHVGRAREESPGGTLLAAMRDAHDAARGERMGDAELCRELRAILFAGSTTTASALAWSFCVLARNPAARDAARAEVREVLDGRSPGEDDLPSLVFLRRVLDEVLRLYPPTWVTARTPLRDDRVGGYRIAAGSLVLLSPFVTHRHPAFWPDPDRFDPDRFAHERRPAPFAYVPFGAGPRSCIGSGVASVELQLVVAMALQRFEFALVPGPGVAAEPGLTLRPRPGVSMILRPVRP